MSWPKLYADGASVRRRYSDSTIEIDFADLRNLAAGVVSPELQAWAELECAKKRRDERKAREAHPSERSRAL